MSRMRAAPEAPRLLSAGTRLRRQQSRPASAAARAIIACARLVFICTRCAPEEAWRSPLRSLRWIPALRRRRRCRCASVCVAPGLSSCAAAASPPARVFGTS